MKNNNILEIDINIDSLPIFNRASTTNFVPILGKLKCNSEVFIIGIFCGEGSDPADMDAYFGDLSEEVNNLKTNGFVFDNEVYRFKIRHWILDQKARAYVKCVKGVRGYYCCEKFTVKGVGHHNRMSLLEQDCTLRADESFLDFASRLMVPRTEHFDDIEVDEHVTGVSSLLECQQQMVSKFRLDAMHLIYKGVFLRWLDYLWSGRGNYSLNQVEKQEISNTIGSFRDFCPCDFNRTPFAFRTPKLKATELRRLLLLNSKSTTELLILES